MTGYHRRQIRKYYITGFICLCIYTGMVFNPSAAYAQQLPDEVKAFTSQREKNTQADPSLPQPDNAPEIEVIEQGGEYRINAVFVIDAPAEHVRHALTDYRHLYRLNPSIIESKILEWHEDGSVSVKTKVMGCAAYFCEELERVEHVTLLPSGDLHARIVPELSQFKSGHTLWRIKPMDERCEITYSSRLVPDIYIPPVVGKFLIKQSIKQEMQTSFTNLEKISKVFANMEWQDNYFPVKTVFSSESPCMNFTDTSVIEID